MRISGKKILAIALSVAMLVSCMVFSFSADASSAIVHTNDYDTVTDTNWASTLPASSAANNNDYSSRSNGAGLAAYDATAGVDGSGAIKLQVNSAYAAGFRVFADTESGNGKIQIGVGKWAVNLAYKVNNVSGPVDLYAAVGGFYWSADWTVAGGKLPDGGACLKKVASFNKGDVTDWVYSGVDFDTTGIIQGLHFFLVSPDTKAPVAAEVVIDEIEAVQYGSSDIKYPVSYVYNGSIVGTSAPGPALAYANMPELDVEVPAGHYLELYSDAALENKINAARHSTALSAVYLKVVKDENAAPLFVEDYERFNTLAFGPLTDNENGYENLYKYSSSSAAGLSGNGSGRILSNKFAESDHGITQAFINAFSDNLALTQIHSGVGVNLVPKAGASYKVTFDVYCSDGAIVETSLFDMAFSDDYFWYRSTHEREKTVTTLTAGEWTTVTLTLDNARANGRLVFGIGVAGHEYANGDVPYGYPPVIYIDNVAVVEHAVMTTTVDPRVQGFEAFDFGTPLGNINHNATGFVQVTKSVKRTGNQSVWLQTSNNGGARRIQFNLPDLDGGYFVAEKGKTYKVSFWLYLKNDGSVEDNPTANANIWLAAADADQQFVDGADVSKYALYNPGNVEYIKGVWNKVTFYTTDPESEEYNGGVMRLGISGPAAAKYTFWVDDLKIEEVADVNGNAWGFETEALNTNVDAKLAKGTTKVSNKYAYTGNQSLYVYNGSNGGRDRNMIYLKDGNGNDVTVEAGKSYIVTFYAMATEETAKSVYLNMWFATGDGTATRPSSGHGDIAMFFDDGSISVVGLTALENKGKWVKVTRYLDTLPETATSNTVGGKLLMGISDPNAGNAGGHWYMDDLSVVCVDDIAPAANDREQYLFGTEVGGVKTNLHKHTSNPQDNGVYTSIRLGAKYNSTKADGSTLFVDGQEYEILERGILVGEANTTIDVNSYKWKSAKAADNGFASNWAKKAVDIADADDQYEIEYTLRLANMNEAWFDGTGNAMQTASYQYRSYYTVKIPYYVKGDAAVRDVTMTIYGETSDAFTFADLVGDFELDGWFSEVEAAE